MYNNFLQEGRRKELEFGNCLISQLGGTFRLSTLSEDINQHIDLWWNNKWSFDIKGLKKSSRTNKNTDSNIHWLEIQNVNGKLGWIFGKCHFFVFEHINCWIIVGKTQLINFVKEYINLNKAVTRNKDLFYSLYQRWERKDIIIKIYTEDLVKISSKILYKDGSSL